MTRWFLCAAPLFCVMLPNMLSAQSYSVGDRVVVIRESPISLPEGQVDDAFIGQVLQVGALNGKWLWVAGGRPGWLDSSSVVPLDRRAIDRLTELIRAEPRNANLYYGRAIVWRELGEMEIAMGDYNEAIRLRPEKAAFFNSRGVAWQNKGEYDKAIADYNEAVRLNPKNEAAYVNRGSAWADKGEYDKAIDDFSEALRLDPKYAFAYNNRGTTWNSKGEYEKAIDDFNEALRLDPKYAYALGNRGIAWSAKGEYDKAIDDFDDALRLDPTFANAVSYRGIARQAKGEYDKAISDFNEALRLEPNEALSYGHRATAWNAKGETDKAIEDYTAALRLDPNAAWAYINRADAWNKKGEYDSAINDCNEALRLEAKETTAYYNRGQARWILRRPDAVDDFQKVIDLQGWNGSSSPYTVIFGVLAARAMKDDARGARFLTDSAGKLKQEWPYPAVRFLAGELDETGLLALADNNDKETEARCYLGYDHLASGRNEEALAHFRWVREHGKKTFTEYQLAIAALNQLEAER